MKRENRRGFLSELLDSIKPKEELLEETAERDDTLELARLGEAFIERLNVPAEMEISEVVDTIISMWENSNAPEAMDEEYLFDGYDRDTEDGELEEDEQDKKKSLPKPIRGGLFELPPADYESMSAEQFRRLKNRLKRASMDGRKIRL